MTFSKICILFFFSYCSVPFFYFAQCIETNHEVSILLSIKESLVDPTDNLKDWKLPENAVVSSSSVHCSWTGVQCDPNGSVQKLDLSNMNLTGSVPDQIQRLQNLKSLNICCNGFDTPLPKSLSKLTSIEYIDLSQNSFFGVFPAGLGMPRGMTALNASGNNFSGHLPEDLGHATSLESLDLRGNFLEGSIPESYKDLVKLKFLGLSGNNLTAQVPTKLGESTIIG